MGQRFIGVDIGSRYARAVALSSSKQAWRNHGCAEVSWLDDLGQRKPLQRVLAELDSRLSLKGTVVVGASDLSSMVRFEHNDPMPPDRMERVLRLELEQHANQESGDLAADAVSIPLGGDEIIHCCGLAQPAQVNALLKEFGSAKINVANVDLAMAAGANAVATSNLDFELTEEMGLVIDIGARTTRVMVMRGNDFLACRQLSIGGDQFTEALAQVSNVEFDEAEKLKVGVDEAISEAIVHDDRVASGESGLRNLQEPIAPVVDMPSFDGPLEVAPGPGPVSHQPLGSDDFIIDPDDEELSEAFGDGLGDGLGGEPSEGQDEEDAFLSDAHAEDGALFIEGDVASANAGGSTPGLGGPAPDLSFDQPAVESKPALAGASDDDFDFALDEPEGDEAPQAQADGDSLSPHMQRVADQLHGQLAKTIVWFQSQLRLKRLKITWVRLGGGAIGLTGLQDYLEKRLQAPVAVLDPFADIGGESAPANPHAFALAVGLARSQAIGAVTFHLIPESVQKKQLFWQQVVWPRVAAGMLVMATIVIAVGLWRTQQAHQARIDHYQQHANQHQELVGNLDKAVKQRDGLLADLKSIASRILGGRDVLYAIKSMKQEAPKELWITSLSTTVAVPGEDVGVGSVGRPRDRRQRGQTPAPVSNRDPARAEARTDTLITSLVLDGKVKPDAGNQDIDLYSIYNTWYNDLLAWSANDGNLELFTDYDHIYFRTERSEAEQGSFPFQIILHLQPTSWEEVASMVNGELD